MTRRDLDAITDDLVTLASWRVDLIERIERALLRFELVGISPIEEGDLVAEVCDFARTCRAMAWRPT